MADVEVPPSTSSSESAPVTYTRAGLRELHERPMRLAWTRHVAGAVEFIKSKVLREALAGYKQQDISSIIDVVPAADEVLEAIGSAAPVAPYPETWTASGRLDPKTGLLLLVSSSTGKFSLRLSAQCMPDIVAALKRIFTDVDIEFVRAAPASGGKDVLSIKWN